MRKKSYDRYRYATIVEGERGPWLNSFGRILNTKPRSDDSYYTVKEGDRLDLIAHRFLGDARLWWVVAEYNDIRWFFDIEVGQELRMPSFEHLHMDLLV